MMNVSAIASGCFDADVYKQSNSVGVPFVVQCTSKDSLTSTAVIHTLSGQTDQPPIV